MRLGSHNHRAVPFKGDQIGPFVASDRSIVGPGAPSFVVSVLAPFCSDALCSERSVLFPYTFSTTVRKVLMTAGIGSHIGSK